MTSSAFIMGVAAEAAQEERLAPPRQGIDRRLARRDARQASSERMASAADPVARGMRLAGKPHARPRVESVSPGGNTGGTRAGGGGSAARSRPLLVRTTPVSPILWMRNCRSTDE
jgi:hypothetical protein